ncbi:MAG: Na+/H+ antiporter [Parachlamydiaceae bacterium]|nr:Na+/H+ antiporter [Parachlamydiaceae bacterium]
MPEIQIIFILIFVAILLVGLAQKIRIPYPVALVFGGASIGFIPGLPLITLNFNLLLFMVLPPILYYAAFDIAFREFQQNWKNIFSLALGLVLLTTVVVACLFHWMFPQFPWALAFVFGAIVSPPDAITVTTLFKRFSIRSRLVTLLEGESLVNDATAIVLYNIAITALISGHFSLVHGSIEFLQVALGGILVGGVLGFAFQTFSKNHLEPVLGVVFSFVIPYVTYIVATFLGVSGVLAVVVNGLIGSRILLTHHSSLRRVIGYATWDIFIILLNAFVFILIGLQLRTIAQTMTLAQMITYSGYALLVALVMLAVRVIWVYSQIALSRLTTRQKGKPLISLAQHLRNGVLIAWSGMRGIVSLAIALALPITMPDGTLVAGRNEVIFMTFVVILLTLVIPGLTLPALVKWLKIQNTVQGYDETSIRVELAKVADEKLRHLLYAKSITHPEFDFLRKYFSSQHSILVMAHSHEHKLPGSERARLKILHAQRKRLIEMWEVQEIDDKLLIHLENELDLIEVHTARAELK